MSTPAFQFVGDARHEHLPKAHQTRDVLDPRAMTTGSKVRATEEKVLEVT
jgi:hypothetical protein